MRNPLLGQPTNCFDAILALLSAYQTDNFHPSQAKICLEVIYRLCAAPISSTITLALLRKCPNGSEHNFFVTQCDACLSKIQFISEVELNEFEYPPNFKADVQQCTAWLLKIYAIEIHVLTTASEYYVDNRHLPMLDLLKSSTHLAHAESAVLSILRTVHFTSKASSTHAFTTLTSAQKKCWRAAMIPLPTTASSTYSHNGCAEPLSFSVANPGSYFQINMDRLEREMNVSVKEPEQLDNLMNCARRYVHYQSNLYMLTSCVLMAK